jgi:predicted helicase
MRQDIAREFTSVYLIDLGGNVRKNAKLSGTTHNVFGIQVGVAITVLVKNPAASNHDSGARISYVRMPEMARRAEKYQQLSAWNHLTEIPWTEITPDERNRWFSEDEDADFYGLMAMGRLRSAKAADKGLSIFASLSNGIQSNNDAYAYSFSFATLKQRAFGMLQAFLEREIAGDQPADLRTSADFCAKI